MKTSTKADLASTFMRLPPNKFWCVDCINNYFAELGDEDRIWAEVADYFPPKDEVDVRRVIREFFGSDEGTGNNIIINSSSEIANVVRR